MHNVTDDDRRTELWVRRRKFAVFLGWGEGDGGQNDFELFKQLLKVHLFGLHRGYNA